MSKRECKKCGKHIPFKVVIEGKQRNIQNRKFCLECSPWKQHNTRDLNNSKTYSRSVYVMNWRNRSKKKLVEYKGGKCERCGYDKDIPRVYDFHHLDPEQKDFSISGKSWSFERLKEEVDKCMMVCKNCHAEIHYELDSENREKRLQVEAKRLDNRICEYCEKEFKPCNDTRKYCSSECAKMSFRKCERPSKSVLNEEIQEMSWTALGKKYGVADNTVRKWARGYGLIP